MFVNIQPEFFEIAARPTMFLGYNDTSCLLYYDIVQLLFENNNNPAALYFDCLFLVVATMIWNMEVNKSASWMASTERKRRVRMWDLNNSPQTRILSVQKQKSTIIRGPSAHRIVHVAYRRSFGQRSARTGG